MKRFRGTYGCAREERAAEWAANLAPTPRRNRLVVGDFSLGSFDSAASCGEVIRVHVKSLHTPLFRLRIHYVVAQIFFRRLSKWVTARMWPLLTHF